MIQISSVETQQGLRALEPEWNPLLQRSRSDGLFLTWEYASLFGEVYGATGLRPLVLVAREAGRLLGVAPLMVVRGEGLLGRQLRCLMFIGQSTDQTPEYLDFFVEPGREAEVGAAFCEHLLGPARGAWDHLLLERIRDDSPNLPVLRERLRAAGVELTRIDETECPFADLSAGWEAYLEQKSSHFRRLLGYNLRRLGQEGEPRFRWVDADVELDGAYERLVRLNRDRWGEQGESFRTEAYCRFHRRFAERCLERGWLMLAELWVGDTVVADKYDFIYGGKVWGNQGGWLSEWEKRKVGKLIIAEVMQRGIDRGCREYDFLGGAAEYKLSWATGSRCMASYIGSNISLRGRVHRGSEQAKAWVKQRLSPARVDQLRALSARLRR